jgi:hypothetical protein
MLVLGLLKYIVHITLHFDDTSKVTSDSVSSLPKNFQTQTFFNN